MGSKVKFEITDAILKQVEALAAAGATQDQISSALDIDRSTFYKNKKLNPDFADAIKRGQYKGISKVENALFNKAVGGDNVACIFYLKNRAPEKWSDRKDLDVKTRIALTDKQKEVLDAVLNGEY